MASRPSFSYDDRSGFYQAWGGLCSYCKRQLEFLDFEIDHIIPWHLNDDPSEWLLTLEKIGLDDHFGVDSDENLRPVCRTCNQLKSGDVLPAGQTMILLAAAKKRAPLVASYREKALSTRRKNNVLAGSAKLVSDPDFRDQLRELLGNNDAGMVVVRHVTPWPTDKNSLRVTEGFGSASASLLGWPQEIDGVWLDRLELAQLRTAMDSAERKIIGLLGAPGTGKSALLARVGSA